MRLRPSTTVMLCVVAVTGALAQQAARATLSGSVVDAAGKVMPGVTISVRGADARQTVTNSDGRFTFSDVPVGDYELRATLVGFRTVVQAVAITETTKPIVIRMTPAEDPVETLFIER